MERFHYLPSTWREQIGFPICVQIAGISIHPVFSIHSGFIVEFEHHDVLPAVSVSRKRSSESQQPFGITLPSKLCSLSESATVPPKDPYTPAGVSSVKETGDNVSKPVATPVKSTYHYVVPRSCWVCSTTKLTKQKMREVYQATLIYHRSTKDTEQLSSKE